MEQTMEKQCPACGRTFQIRCSSIHHKEYARRTFCSFACRHYGGYFRNSPDIHGRFWSKVDRSGGPDACWNWTSALRSKGYGDFLVRGKERCAAHRLSYIWAYGPIPNGLFVLHRCDNKLCVNPAHLFLGTHHDNMNDLTTKRRLGIRS